MSCGLRYVKWCCAYAREHTVAGAAALPHILRWDRLDQLGHLKNGSVFDAALNRDIGFAALRGALA